MNLTRYCTGLYSLLLAVGILTGCDQRKPASGSNQVTVNPVTTPSKDQAAQLGFDKSPLDLIYYPIDYPKLKMAGTPDEPLIARVVYSRPQRDGRTIFGDLVQYGSVWRLGANEATEIEFFKDVIIDNKKVAKGRYVLYCIPYENKWTLILNNDLYIWGLKIDTTKDAYKFTIPIAKTRYPFEAFTMEFEKADKGARLVMEWDSIQAALPINW